MGSDVAASNLNLGLDFAKAFAENGYYRIFKPEQVFLSLFGGRSSGAIKAIEGVTLYVIIGVSAQELPDVEELYELDPNAVIVMYNLKLDVLRGDIGNPAFPPKDLHDR